VGRPDGAKIWARVLSELAQVPVVVEWERPAWRVRWQDGPTLRVLRDRAAALGGFRVAAALPFDQLRFARSDSRLAVGLGWLRQGSPASPAAARGSVADVEAFCAETGYPELRFEYGVLAAADLLSRLGQGDITEMGVLLARAHPPVSPQPLLASSVPDLPGRVESYRWPSGGPPAELLGPADPPLTAHAESLNAEACHYCGRPLAPSNPRRGRPAKFCSGACRTAAHRAHHRAADPAA
jgi:hypothetical protein